MLQRVKIRLGFISAFVLLLAMAASTFWTVASFNARAGWVDHTQEVQRRLERLVALLADVESGSRGYVITGNPTFLEPYHTARDLVGNELTELDALTSGSPQRQDDLIRLRPLVAAKLATSQRHVELRAVD